MRITNKHNLPQPFVNLFAKQEYSKGHARMSVTELISPPRVVALRNQYRAKIEEDITERFWALMGTNIHRILQEGADAEHLAEERLFTEVEGWVISGAIDVQKTSGNGIELIDWKFTSAYSVMKDDKSDWTKQLNCYAWLVRRVKGADVKKLSVCAIVRDWDKNRAAYDKKGYPKQPVTMVDLEMWDDKDAELFIRDRVRLHRDVHRGVEWGEGLPLCSDEERWSRGNSYAAFRRNGPRVRAARVFDNSEEADRFAASGDYEIVERKGEPVRCVNNYCGVAKWCDQFNGG
jgi:hypothetical protein